MHLRVNIRFPGIEGGTRCILHLRALQAAKEENLHMPVLSFHIFMYHTLTAHTELLPVVLPRQFP